MDKIDVKLINPKNHEKYSPNLYKWLKKRDESNRQKYRVYKKDDGVLYIGEILDGGLSGTRLITVLCLGSKAEELFFCDKNQYKEVVGFWENYIRIGRCAIDPEHREYFSCAGSRFIESNECRVCNWCGQKQKKVITTRVIQDVSWVNFEGE